MSNTTRSLPFPKRSEVANVSLISSGSLQLAVFNKVSHILKEFLLLACASAYCSIVFLLIRLIFIKSFCKVSKSSHKVKIKIDPEYLFRILTKIAGCVHDSTSLNVYKRLLTFLKSNRDLSTRINHIHSCLRSPGFKPRAAMDKPRAA